MNLAWADGDSYTIEEREEVTEEAIAEEILKVVGEHPGASWNTIDAEVTGKGETKRAVRDRLIADGELLNAAKGKRFELWLPDDPAAPAGDET